MIISDRTNAYCFKYQDWYVLHTDSNKSGKLLQYVKKKLGNAFPIVIFTRELIHRKGDRFLTVEKALFPGYIFVQKQLSKVEHLLKDNFKDIYIAPVKFEGKLAKVHERDMEYLFRMANDEGKISISKAYEDGDSIVITSGPLFNVGGEVKFIDKRKRKVKVSFPLLNDFVDVSLSYDLVERKSKLSSLLVTAPVNQ